LWLGPDAPTGGGEQRELWAVIEAKDIEIGVLQSGCTRSGSCGGGWNFGSRSWNGYWHSFATLTRWCRIRSYLDSAAAHGITALDAIRAAIEGNPWLPPQPATI
jgi:hypothetical protein